MGIEHEVIDDTVDGDGGGIGAGEARGEIVSSNCLLLCLDRCPGDRLQLTWSCVTRHRCPDA